MTYIAVLLFIYISAIHIIFTAFNVAIYYHNKFSKLLLINDIYLSSVMIISVLNFSTYLCIHLNAIHHDIHCIFTIALEWHNTCYCRMAQCHDLFSTALLCIF